MINKLGLIALLVAFVSLLWQLKTHNELKQTYCDLASSIHIERRFIQTVITELHDDKYADFSKKILYPNGEEVTNPITTNQKYRCE